MYEITKKGKGSQSKGVMKDVSDWTNKWRSYMWNISGEKPKQVTQDISEKITCSKKIRKDQMTALCC